MDDSDKTVSKRPSDGQEKAIVLAAKTLQTQKEVREVLPEEAYLEKLDHIIQRDYFPDVPKLKAQLEYIKAVDRNDVAKIRELQLRYSTKRTDRRTSPTRRSPDVFDPETPGTRPSTSRDANQEGDNDSSQTTGKDGKLKAENMSVDKFLSKYTSEDNASFSELAALSDQREHIKHAWMYSAEEAHNKERVSHVKPALLGADEQFALPAPPRPCDIDNWSYKARNSVLFHPEDAPLTVEEHIRRQKMNQREIRKEGTRFLENPWKEQVKQDTMNRAAVLHAATVKGHVDVSGEVAPGFKHPGQQFSYLATPSPAPGVAESPMMTWGEIEGTPFRLDASDMTLGDGGPMFKIPDVPYRDKLAQEITDKIGKRFRERRQKAVQQAEALHIKTPRFGSVRSAERLGTMSPAARRLATNKLGIRIGTDKALKASYTPSPGRIAKTPTRTPKLVRTATEKKTASAADTAVTSSITDNLLDLSSSAKPRPSAADFF